MDFCYSTYKKHNAGVVVPAADIAAAVAFLSNTFLAIFAFFDYNCGDSSCRFIKVVIYICFCFFTYKNYNVRIAAISISSQSNVPVFAFYF